MLTVGHSIYAGESTGDRKPKMEGRMRRAKANVSCRMIKSKTRIAPECPGPCAENAHAIAVFNPEVL